MPPPHKSFQVPLFTDDGNDPRQQAAATDVRNILQTISKSRENVSFAILERDEALCSSVAACSGISCGYSKLDQLTASLGANIRTCHLRIPGEWQDLDNIQGADELDLHIIFLDDFSHAFGGISEFHPERDVQSLVSCYAAAAGWYNLPARVASTGYHGRAEPKSGRCTSQPSIQRQHGASWPLSTEHISLDELLTKLDRDSSSVNGVVLASTEAGLALVERASRIDRACATFGHLRASSDPLAIFELQIPDLISDKGHSAVITPLVVQSLLNALGLPKEAHAIGESLGRTLDPSSYLGSNLLPTSLGGSTPDEIFTQTFLHHLGFFLETANSHEATRSPAVLHPQEDATPRQSRRPMNLVEKIITQSAVGLRVLEVEPGQMICVKVDWTLTSELLWGGMEKTYNEMNRPRPYRNDRIWLAVDHTVDPRTSHLAKQKRLIKASERFRDEAKIINYLPANTSIMHTDFTREKAQPGTIVVGSDSHTCSSGSMGALAVGFGAADVVMPLVTGQTWFRVPEVCRINFVGRPAYGISGKDVILHVLGLFKRNTIAFQRAVEYGGPSLSELSMDARFAIANMTTEFGGMGACFEADGLTSNWISKRRSRQDRKGGFFFLPDSTAKYAEVRTIDLSQVAFTMAIYPNPDDVVPVSCEAETHLDGCFIGACTTTEQELILGALVLEAGLRSGLVPTSKGKRRVTPGSMIITNRLVKLGLLEIYREAGFDIGAPGCSYCVGINDVDVAREGEVWLSSQNRNFKNRMGKGSIGNITSAAAVAASSFSMRITDPKSLLNMIEKGRFALLDSPKAQHSLPVTVQEPRASTLATETVLSGSRTNGVHAEGAGAKTVAPVISNIQRFGTNIDT